MALNLLFRDETADTASVTPELHLTVSWLPSTPERLDGLVLRRGRANVLTFDDGITQEVRVLDPAGYRVVDALLGEARRQKGPGRVVLVAGALPVAWRAALRQSGVSFMDVAGVVEIDWPRTRVSTARFAHTVQRHRSPISLQQGHALILQELLLVTAGGSRPTIGELARETKTSLSTASRAISQLAEHGLVSKDRDENHVRVTVEQRTELADRLAKQTKWPGQEELAGYLWGRNAWDVAARISTTSVKKRLNLTITGRGGASFLGVPGTTSPGEIRCWVGGRAQRLESVADLLEVEVAPEGQANVILSTDRWGLGVHRGREARIDQWRARIANPIRVWCDLHSELRGTEFAAQVWELIGRG